MRRLTRLILSIALAAVWVLGFSITAFAADSSVTYDGEAKKFIFAPDNLFSDFNNVMPGDSITRQIVVNNRKLNNVKIKVYMRSLGANEGSEEFLSRLYLTVKQSGASELFSAPANQTAGLTDWTYIGTVYSGGNIKLDVTLDVPVQLGNDFQDAVGAIDWQFRIEELPVEPTDPTTGDESGIILFAVLCVASAFTFMTLLIKQRKRRNAE